MRIAFRVLSILVACLAAAQVCIATNQGGNSDLPRFSQVSDGLYRGGQPSKHGLEQLKALGIKTVISLRHNHLQVIQEEHTARALGLGFKRLPLDGLHKVSKETIDQFFEIVENPANQPVFVHCEYGQDRTGALIGIYRQEVQKWSAKKAYDEMVSMGFETKYAWLADSVFDYEEDKLGTMTDERPLGVKMLDSVQTTLGTRPSLKTRPKQPVEDDTQLGSRHKYEIL